MASRNTEIIEFKYQKSELDILSIPFVIGGNLLTAENRNINISQIIIVKITLGEEHDLNGMFGTLFCHPPVALVRLL